MVWEARAVTYVVVELREHLVALPAQLGAVGARLVVKARVDDAAVTLGSPLADVISGLEHDDRGGGLRELARDSRADAACADDRDVVRAILLGRRVARLRARARNILNVLVGASRNIELVLAILERDPVAPNVCAVLHRWRGAINRRECGRVRMLCDTADDV